MKPVESRVTAAEGISVLAVAVAIGGVRAEGVGGVNGAGGFIKAVSLLLLLATAMALNV